MKYLLETILENAIKRNATDIHLIGYNDQIKISFRINGHLDDYSILDQEEGIKLIHYIKYLSGLDLDYFLSLKTGGFTSLINGRNYRFRVSLIPTMSKEHIVIRVLDSIHFTHLEQITQDTHMISMIREIENLQNGLILISGATGAGKSTTLHVILKEIYEKQQLNIITIEDPIEMIVPEFTQIQISKKINYDDALKQILRHDPDVIMIGELRDQYSAKLAVRCALTGCLVFATIHSNSAKTTMKRLKNLDIDQIELNEVLNCVIAQQLIFKNNHASAIFEYYIPKSEVLYSYHDSMNYYEKDQD